MYSNILIILFLLWILIGNYEISVILKNKTEYKFEFNGIILLIADYFLNGKNKTTKFFSFTKNKYEN